MKSLYVLCALIGCCLGLGLHAAIVPPPAAPAALSIILLGPPGSGKGTQAMRLSRALNIPHISTGDLFRDHIKRKTELGIEASTYMNQGKLVPDQLTLNMLFARVAQSDCAHGYILDGFPRTLLQAEALDARLPPSMRFLVMNLDVPDEALVERAVGRRICSKCGAIHHVKFSPPRVEGECDSCSSQLTHRADDTEEVVKERLKVYHAQTAPVIDYYQKKGILETVDGTQKPDVVFDSLLDKVEKAKAWKAE